MEILMDQEETLLPQGTRWYKYIYARPAFWNNKWHSWNFYKHHANRSHITSSLLYPTIKNTYMMTIKVSQIGETQAPVNERMKFYVVINV